MTLRSLALLFVIGLGVVHAEGAKEAQALFEAMEAKLVAAKSLKVSFDSLMGPEGNQLQFKASLALATGNKVKFSCESALPNGDPLTLGVASDGTTTRNYQREGDKIKEEVEATQPHLGKVMRIAFSRLSVVAPLFMMRVDKDDDDPLAVEGFSLGAKEQDGERTLQVIEFDAKGEHESFRVKLWIDTVSGLPAKRVLSSARQASAVTETITSIELDATFAEGTFDVQASDAKPEPEAPPTSRPGK